MKLNEKRKIIILITLGIIFTLLLIIINSLTINGGNSDKNSEYSHIINSVTETKLIQI